jgi:hypothetical protein
LPASALELESRLAAYDARLTQEGLIDGGDLLRHILRSLMAAGHGSEVEKWEQDAIVLAVDETKRFEKECRAKQGRHTQTNR